MKAISGGANEKWTVGNRKVSSFEFNRAVPETTEAPHLPALFSTARFKISETPALLSHGALCMHTGLISCEAAQMSEARYYWQMMMKG